MTKFRFSTFIRNYSIDNIRIGKVLTKHHTIHTVRIGNATVTLNYAGNIYVGKHVTVACPDGDIGKAYILSSNSVGIGDGGNEVI